MARVHAGDVQALDELIPLVYPELKKLASAHLRREGRAGAAPDDSVGARGFSAHGERASSGVRESLAFLRDRGATDAADPGGRGASTQRRETSAMEEAAGVEMADPGGGSSVQLLAMNDALDLLERDDPLKARLIEMRYFAGMTAEESATAMGISVHVVQEGITDRAGLATAADDGIAAVRSTRRPGLALLK